MEKLKIGDWGLGIALLDIQDPPSWKSVIPNPQSPNFQFSFFYSKMEYIFSFIKDKKKKKMDKMVLN